MDAACCAERRAFLKALTVTTAALMTGGCNGSGSPKALVAVAQNPPPAPLPAPLPGANNPPVWSTVPTITFTQGVKSSISIAGYVSDPNGDPLTITMNSAVLPDGVTFDAANKRFVYDGVGAVGTTNGVVLTADDGKP